MVNINTQSGPMEVGGTVECQPPFDFNQLETHVDALSRRYFEWATIVARTDIVRRACSSSASPRLTPFACTSSPTRRSSPSSTRAA